MPFTAPTTAQRHYVHRFSSKLAEICGRYG